MSYEAMKNGIVRTVLLSRRSWYDISLYEINGMNHRFGIVFKE